LRVGDRVRAVLSGDRANFANGGGVIALHPDFTSRV
jgi:hypothetical protein